MPRISAFYGIVIRMFYEEGPHPGRPHFHATYAGQEASIDIDSLEVIAGRLPRRAERLVAEWGREHRDELLRNWRRARSSEELQPIDPLP